MCQTLDSDNIFHSRRMLNCIFFNLKYFIIYIYQMDEMGNLNLYGSFIVLWLIFISGVIGFVSRSSKIPRGRRCSCFGCFSIFLQKSSHVLPASYEGFGCCWPWRSCLQPISATTSSTKLHWCCTWKYFNRKFILLVQFQCFYSLKLSIQLVSNNLF